MQGRALVLVAAMLAAGCVGALADGTVPAGELLSTAWQAAAERIDDPELVRVEGVEPPHRVETDDQTLVVHEDPRPGDGQAPAWTYTFLGRERAATVAVRDDGEIVAEVVDASPQGLEPLEDWSLDSDEAAEAIVAHPGVSEPGEDVIVEWRLAGGGAPVWEAALHTPASLGRQKIVLDARDGEVIEVEGCRDADSRRGEGSIGNTSGPLTPAFDMSVDIDLPHPGWVNVSWSLHGGIDEATAELLHDGTVIREETMAGVGGRSVKVAEADPGTYDARLTTEDGVHDAEIGISAAWTLLEC